MDIQTPREAAWQWLNTKVDTPYRWGGNEVKDGGFDCSGLANGALRKFGITSKDLNAAGLARMFPTVKKEHLRYGDLLFWRSKTGSGKIVHVEVVWALLGDNIYTIGASGGGPWTTTVTAAMLSDARVKIHKAPADWFARNPYGD